MNPILPKPQRLEAGSGSADASGGFELRGSAGFSASLQSFVETYFPHREGRRRLPLAIEADASMKPEAYVLTITPKLASIRAAGRAGAFWAIQTLRQLLDLRTGTLPAVHVEDAPDLPLRGFMMDIARDKIPTMETVKAFVDAMALVKLNHFELYVEGFAFAYPSFPEVWQGETPFTPAEYRELDRYCADRCIDFVPNQNGFGHMSAWLARPEFHGLAECEDGFVAWGFPFPASTLNPLDPRSRELVAKLYGDMLPHCGSRYFNLCGDEPFELGEGKSKAACAARGRETVYVDFVNGLCAEARKYGKTPLLWGDVLVNHPEAARNLPDDVVFIDWGYDRGYPFATHAEAIAKTGLRLLAAPGTSSWNSFTSRRRDMLATTRDAAGAMKRHGGLGLLQTDWGDFGHLQYLPFSWPGMLEAAGVAWSEAPDEADVVRHIDVFLAPEAAGMAGRCLIDLATYAALEREYVYNATMAFRPILYADPAPDHPLPLKIGVLRDALGKAPYGESAAAAVTGLTDAVRRKAEGAPASLVRDEIVNAARMTEAAVRAHRVLEGGKDESAAELLAAAIAAHRGLWLARNRQGGLQRSLARPLALKSVLEAVGRGGL